MNISASSELVGDQPPPFSLSTVEPGEVFVVRMAGELDIIAVGEVSAALDASVSSGLPVIADATEVRFCCSTVLGVLYNVHVRATKAGRRFVVVTDKRALLRPLRILGLLDAMTVLPDVDAALRELELWDLAPSDLGFDDQARRS
ncbi:STAS domain-containing protein [Lentzea sp. NPDC059081]|uniref:STAS domain-containing protein n=1 Tax=Lentzea sp. NPDC059081 TaxID=3346719 RepID=UPI0036A33F8B